MKKIKKDVKLALEYIINNPKTSFTKAEQIFKVARHTLAKHKNDYLLYTYENISNPNDEYLYYFSQEDLIAIQYYLDNPTKGYKELQKECPYMFGNAKTLYHYLEILGKEKTEGKRIKYHYNRQAFKTIDTEEDAYWLGFLTADGCIVEGKWLALGLGDIDKDHLIKFCKYLQMPDDEIPEIIISNFGGAYTRDNIVNSIKICSLEICNNLIDKGITPRKSGKEKPYICSSIELEKAYIRGIIDGDGYLRTTQIGFGVVGSYEICKYIKDFIQQNIVDVSTNHISKHGIIYKFALSGNKSKDIATYLYSNANIYLTRKYNLFKQ